MKEKYREGYCPGCYFMGRDIVRRAIVQGAIIREGNRPGGQLSVPHLSLMFMYFCIMVRNTTKIVFKIILRIVLIISDHILLSNFTLVNSISNYSFSHENRDLLCNPSPMREQICTSNVPLMCTEFFTRYKYRIRQQIVRTNISRLSIVEVKKKVI